MPKIPDYPALTTPNNNDLLVIEDSVSSSTKKITRGNLLGGSSSTAFTAPTITSTGDLLVRNVSVETIKNETTFDYIASGCVWSGDSYNSTRNASCTAGVVYIAGKRLTVAAVTARSFTASKDVYCDLKDNGDNTAVWVYYDNTTNAASPSFATTTGTLRGAIIVVGASSIVSAASVNQGEYDKVLPIASGVAYTTTDSLGNLIAPRDPQRRLLGYRQVIANPASIGTTITQVAGLSCPVIVPTNRKAVVTSDSEYIAPSNAGTDFKLQIFDGAVGGTKVAGAQGYGASAGVGYLSHIQSPPLTASGSKTYNLGIATTTGTVALGASAGAPAWIKVELL